MVLAEPGAAHEHAQVSVDVMNKYGILEKGMELSDVAEYVAGTQLGQPEQIFLLRASDRELGSTSSIAAFVRTHSVVEGNLFRISRSESVLDTLKIRLAKSSSRRVAEGEAAPQGGARQAWARMIGSRAARLSSNSLPRG